MTFILTNDDGIDFPCPPKEQHSGCGHRVTTNRPIHLKKRSDSEYVVDGTPADCTRLALTQVAKETKWVLSGINAGGNLGVDIYISGTVAAVREAAIHGVPGIAISHWIKRPLVIDWDLATKWTAKVLEKLWSYPLSSGSFWNVNLPHLELGSPEPEIVFCEKSTHPLPVNYWAQGEFYYYQGKYAKRQRSQGTDVDICFSGRQYYSNTD